VTTEAARDEIVRWCRYLSARSLSPGTSGNVSVRLAEGFVCTPTGLGLDGLEPKELAVIDASGNPVGERPRPTKEWRLHLALYEVRPDVEAVVHLHSTFAVAASCRSDVSEDDVIPPLTSYYAMHVDRLPLVRWHPPGDPALARALRERAPESATLLLANHGPVVGAASLERAAYIAEEIEEAARIWLSLGNFPRRLLSADQISRLRRH